MWPHWCWAKGTDHLPWPTGRAPPNAAQDKRAAWKTVYIHFFLVLVFSLNLSSTMVSNWLERKHKQPYPLCLHFARLNKLNVSSLLVSDNIHHSPVLPVTLLWVCSSTSSSSLRDEHRACGEFSRWSLSKAFYRVISTCSPTEGNISRDTATHGSVIVSRGCALPAANKF